MSEDVSLGLFEVPTILCRCGYSPVFMRPVTLHPTPRVVVRCMSQNCPDRDREKLVIFPPLEGKYLIDANN